MEEHFDILDADGQLTGVTKPRSEVHRNGLRHRTVYVWIVNSLTSVIYSVVLYSVQFTQRIIPLWN